MYFGKLAFSLTCLNLEFRDPDRSGAQFSAYWTRPDLKPENWILVEVRGRTWNYVFRSDSDSGWTTSGRCEGREVNKKSEVKGGISTLEYLNGYIFTKVITTEVLRIPHITCVMIMWNVENIIWNYNSSVWFASFYSQHWLYWWNLCIKCIIFCRMRNHRTKMNDTRMHNLTNWTVLLKPLTFACKIKQYNAVILQRHCPIISTNARTTRTRCRISHNLGVPVFFCPLFKTK